MNIRLKRYDHPTDEFKCLIAELDKYLSIIDGSEHYFYDQFNSIENLSNIVMVYLGDKPVGCGAFRKFDSTTSEIKRMYISPDQRGTGIAMMILKELELWSKEIGYQACLLETGKRMPEAIRFYKKAGYQSMPNFGQYQAKENSLCFIKQLI